MSEELKPCPLCGKEAELLTQMKPNNVEAYIRCTENCFGFCCASGWQDSREAAEQITTFKWNHRQQPDNREQVRDKFLDEQIRKTALQYQRDAIVEECAVVAESGPPDCVCEPFNCTCDYSAKQIAAAIRSLKSTKPEDRVAGSDHIA